MKLTEKQKKFCDYYIETCNGTQSAIRAGYKPKTASVIANENLSKPYIKAYIDKIMDEKDNERIASQDEILELLTNFARGNITEETIVAYNKHYDRVHKQCTPRDRLKAAELLGKRYSLFTDNVKHSGEVGMRIEIDYGEDDSEGSV